METPTKTVNLEKKGSEYSIKAEPIHGVVTIQIECLPNAVLTKEVFLPSNVNFATLEYQSKVNKLDEFKTIKYPEKIKPFEINENVRLDLKLTYDNPLLAPNNTFLIFQHISIPLARSVYHFNPSSLNMILDFHDPEVLNSLNGDYELKIVAKFPNIEKGTKEWVIGTIKAEMTGGKIEFNNIKHKGSLKQKEIRHNFTPELVYAPITISLPVGGFIVVLLIIFIIKVCCLGVNFNNWPSTFTGGFHAFIFIVLYSIILRFYYGVLSLFILTSGLICNS